MIVLAAVGPGGGVCLFGVFARSGICQPEQNSVAKRSPILQRVPPPLSWPAHSDLEQNLPRQAAEAAARQSVLDIAAAHRSGDRLSTPADAQSDVRFGRRTWDNAAQKWVESWGTAPFNMAEVTFRRSKANGTELPLSFAKLIGHNSMDLLARAVHARHPAVGFAIPPGSGARAGVLPITVDIGTWDNLMAVIDGSAANDGSNGYPVAFDTFKYNPVTGGVSFGSDGIPEINIYPHEDTSLPPGNRGTVDLGSPNNSTADLARQILHGLNEFDLSFFPNNEIRTDLGPLYINGDTGLSAGIKDELTAIKGEPRAIPIFTEVSGNGNNATYTVVKFVGVRIVSVRLTGIPRFKHVLVQPAAFLDDTALAGRVPLQVDSILTRSLMIR